MTKDFLPRCAWKWAGAAIGFALWWCVFRNPAELSIRHTGLLLQLLGIGTAFWGIVSLTSRVTAWLGLPRNITCELSTGHFAFHPSDARAHVTHGPGATIETRLDALEKNVPAMEERVIKEIDEQFRKFTDMVKGEEQSR